MGSSRANAIRLNASNSIVLYISSYKVITRDREKEISSFCFYRSYTAVKFLIQPDPFSQKVEEEPKLQEEYIVSDIDPESITFMDCNEETNGSGTGSFNASLSEDAEESSSSSLKAMELYSGSLPSQDNSPADLDETGQIKLVPRAPDAKEKERKRTKEEFAKFGESIAVQLAEIPDSYSRSVAKLRINQILFEAEIGIYAQTHR